MGKGQILTKKVCLGALWTQHLFLMCCISENIDVQAFITSRTRETTLLLVTMVTKGATKNKRAVLPWRREDLSVCMWQNHSHVGSSPWPAGTPSAPLGPSSRRQRQTGRCCRAPAEVAGKWSTHWGNSGDWLQWTPSQPQAAHPESHSRRRHICHAQSAGRGKRNYLETFVCDSRPSALACLKRNVRTVWIKL